jgi:hypothetical protein
MTLMLRKTKPMSFELPPEGETWATLVKISEAKDDNKRRPRVTFTWEACKLVDSHGRPFRYFDTFVNTSYSKGHAVECIEVLTGKKPGEKDDYDLHDLVGIKAQLTIVHKKVNGNTYANIASIRRSEITDEDIDGLADACVGVSKFSDADDPELTDVDIPFFN